MKKSSEIAALFFFSCAGRDGAARCIRGHDDGGDHGASEHGRVRDNNGVNDDPTRDGHRASGDPRRSDRFAYEPHHEGSDNQPEWQNQRHGHRQPVVRPEQQAWPLQQQQLARKAREPQKPT